jgi:putative FmdB family regulatory protein
VIYTHRCDNCGKEGPVNQAMSDHPITYCPECKLNTYLRRITKAPAARMGQSVRNDGYDYREDLARFPNDPQACVDGPRALQRLKDQRQREGWKFQKIDEARQAPPKTDPTRSIAREAYEAARAKGFNPEES